MNDGSLSPPGPHDLLGLPAPSAVPKAEFRGAARLRHLSARLAAGFDDVVEDQEVARALGEEAVGPFRYAQRCLEGRRRRTTREPVICHSADIALRAADLGYGPVVISACLLHDAVEDLSHDLVDAARLTDEIAARFGAEVALDNHLLTNRFSIILDDAQRFLPARQSFTYESLGQVRAAIERVREALPSDVAHRYRRELAQILEYFLPRVDLSEGAQKARFDRNHTLSRELSLQFYELFIEEMADEARTPYRPEGRPFHETPVVVKCLDLIDNIRTLEVSDWQSIERGLRKAEFFLDKTFFLHAHLHSHGYTARTTFVLAYEHVKHHLVEQLAERQRALGHLADTRFAYLVAFLVEQMTRLQAKYEVGDDPVGRLDELREVLRDVNARLTGRTFD